MSEAPRRQSFLAASTTTYATHLAAAALSLANVLVVSRALGPVGRGDVAFLTTIGMLVAYLANLGINQSNANLGGTRPELRPSLATNSVVFAALLGALAALVVTGLVALFPGVAGDSSAGLRWLALAAIPALILQTYLSNLIESDYGFRLTNLAWLAAPTVNVGVNAGLAAAGVLSVRSAVATWVAAWALSVAILVAAVARGSRFGRPDLGLARSMLGFGLKTHGGRILLVGNYRLDQWLVGTMAGSRELGLYSVAVAWSEALFLLPTALVTVQRPDLVRGSRQEAARRSAAAFRVASVLTAGLGVLLVLAAPILCVTIFGEAFRGSIGDLRILAAGGIGIVTLKLLGQALTAQRLPLLETAAIAIAFALGIALDLLLIPEHGGGGAALAATLAYTGGGIVVAMIFLRALGGRAREFIPRMSDLQQLARRPARPGTPS